MLTKTKIITAALVTTGIGFFSVATAQEVATQSRTRPNIGLILADDLGFTDISPFGSEIDTPNIAELAAAGVSFTNYHTAGSCAPARAMLLTGVNAEPRGI